MAGENYVVTRENGFLSVVRNRNCKAKGSKVHADKCIFNIAGNTEGLEEGDILRADNLDFELKKVKYTEDGKQHSKIIMFLYGWEKA